MSRDADLMAALKKGEADSTAYRPCQACVTVKAVSDEARPDVIRALGGTIGETSLAAILTANGYPTGRRAINRHRREGHTP